MLATVPVQASGGCWHQPTRATGGGNTDDSCLATGKLVWQCGDHTAEPESAIYSRFRILPKHLRILCGTW